MTQRLEFPLQDRSHPQAGSGARAMLASSPMAFEVVVGLPPLMSQLTPSLPRLLIDASQERIASCRHTLEGSEIRGIAYCRQAVVGCPEAGDIIWTQFNDERLDGPWSETYWRRHFTNARAIGHRQCLPISLEELLNEWQEAGAACGQERGCITIRQGDPKAVIQSSGPWLDRFAHILVNLPATDPEVVANLDSWLTARGFLRTSASSMAWQRDPVLAGEYALAKIQQRCQELEDQLATSSVRRLLAEETLDQISKKKTEVEEMNRMLSAEREALLAESQQQDATLSQISQSIHELQMREQGLVAERDQAAGERDALSQDNQRLRQENQELTGQRHQLNHVHNQLVNEHHNLATRFSALEALHHSLQQERDELAHHYHMLAEERSRLESLLLESQEQIKLLNASVAQGERQIASLKTTNDLLIEERDAMFRKLSEKDKLGEDADLSVDWQSKKQPSIREIFLSGRHRSSDKWETYLDTYDSLLAPYRNREVRLLEIGVQNGGSLEGWAEFLGPKAVVVGVDIDPSCGLLDFESPQVRCYVGDATSRAWMEELCRKHGPFDIVIDDGSHLSEEIIASFRTLYPRLARGGLYVVEDLHCCYFASHGGGAPGTMSTAMSFFQALTDVLNHEHWSERSLISLEEALPVIGAIEEDGLSLESLLQLEAIEFHNSLVALRRRPLGINTLGVRVVGSGKASVSKEPCDLQGSRLSKP